MRRALASIPDLPGVVVLALPPVLWSDWMNVNFRTAREPRKWANLQRAAEYPAPDPT